ncbi:hypothetical protein SPRG_16406 [Saprolegnia parasitica CBS 223.65]|uniref:Uncharacterized protein n=1 Tax=Saprolegnia parasitica (strain CBS 223.65) TaxID=695850 RepID=A0A067BIH8_SAPPC|nr:hypothetical protein SPRG_16406 [Saprolegnia parasitica CBS 223.65]KDO18174.1 hypothetical protein SPRG_16406 [Saprolegnia parasitica CBS 223.65]|eukprot:XP_012211120.1 hypothetical protein SPRG_16406 [Saprolegnia parasitica CBS 223.65]
MAATFRSVVLGQPEIAAIVFGYQVGVYDDVRMAFAACNELLEFDARDQIYNCDASFRSTFAPGAAWAGEANDKICALAYGLDDSQWDARLPLHVAIAEGLLHLTKRIVRCRPDLASEDAILVAFSEHRLEIVELLLDLRATVPKLRRRIHVADDGSVQRASYFTLTAMPKMLSRDDAKGVVLLERFGLRPDDLTSYDMRHAIYQSTLANATLALDTFPWLHYPSLLDDVAIQGFLPLVQTLHERGFACSVDAMDFAAAEGHLDVVQFLHKNRTEGCSVYALEYAIINGHFNVVRFLIEHRTEGASHGIFDGAAGSAGLDVVQYLHSLGTFDCTVNAVDEAVAWGNLPVVQFLLTNRDEGCTRDIVVQKALAGGHLRMAEYLLSLGYPFPTATPDVPVEYFRKPEMLGVVQLLVDHGASWGDDWMVFACSGNNLPLVQFLHERTSTCSHENDVLKHAIEANAWTVVDYLLGSCMQDISIDALKAALCFGKLDLASVILQRQPELRRHDELLQTAVNTRKTEVVRFLLTAGIGKPRDCLLKIAGRRSHVSESKLLLPFCMGSTNHLDNVVFLLILVALPDRRRSTTLRLITTELTYQFKKVNQRIELAPSVAARATTLLKAGEVVDWALALTIGHRKTTDAISLVCDAELKAQLTHLLAKKRKRSTQ